jgi:hypothetical protein
MLSTTIALRESSTPHSYYFGDYQGTLQYKKSKDELISLTDFNDDVTNGYELDSHSLENKLRALPHTRKPEDFKILLVMKAVRNEEIWLKFALENKNTGSIALLTTTNSKENITRLGNRAIKSHDSEWYVGFYRMAAPMCFWKELKNRLID